MGEYKFCYNCMEKHDINLTVCPKCGYNESAPYNPMYITPGTILQDRYIVGVLLSFNGEGATYLGYDTVISCKVLIREYMPINLCGRIHNKATISVNYNNLAKYKAFMAEYTELNKSLARLRGNTNISPTLDMFAANNTTYTVFEYIDGVSILDFLKDNAGELSWDVVSKIFPPLFTTIGILHNAGILHRAISPDTVYVTNKGELKLSGFCISAVRTADAGLEYELFKGYAAPEQYSASSSSHQGTWTDVYSICALLYRILTGCMPTDSPTRMEYDDLCAPHIINSNVPQHISRVIMDGMNLSSRDRIQTITELVTRLFEQPADIRAVYPENTNYQNEYYPDNNQNGYNNQEYNDGYYSEPQNEYPQNFNDEYYDDGYDDESLRKAHQENKKYRYEKVTAVDKLKVPIIFAIFLLVILLVAIIVFFNTLDSDDNNNSTVNSSSVTDNIVEGTTEEPSAAATTDNSNGVMLDLKGKFYESSKEKYKEYFNLDAIQEYNDEYAVGQIFEQSVAPGDPFQTGDTITVKVSKGKEVVTIPDYEGLTIAQYEAKLKEIGITEYSLISQISAESGTPNTVLTIMLGDSPVTPGSTFKRSEDKRLIIYYLSPDAVIITTTVPVTTEVVTTEVIPTTETVTTTETPTEAPTEAPTEVPPEPTQEQQEPVDENSYNNPDYIPEENEYG